MDDEIRAALDMPHRKEGTTETFLPQLSPEEWNGDDPVERMASSVAATYAMHERWVRDNFAGNVEVVEKLDKRLVELDIAMDARRVAAWVMSDRLEALRRRWKLQVVFNLVVMVAILAATLREVGWL
jgi:hypothetical protein